METLETLETLEKVKKMSDNEALTYYEAFSRELITKTKNNLGDILEAVKSEETNLGDEINSLLKVDIDKLEETNIKGKELIDLSRASLEVWARDSQLSPLLNDFLDKPQPQKMAAGILVSLLVVIVSTLVCTSTKIRYEEGKLKEFSFSASNISDNAVNMVKAILGSIPESVKKAFS